MKTSRILELAGLPNQNAKLLESEELAEHYPGAEHYPVKDVLSVMGKQPERFKGNFICSYKKLTSLEGSPSTVSGDFSCYHNDITSLRKGPSSVGGDFSCGDNKLVTLRGVPSSINGSFNCSHNKLKSLQLGPSSVGGDFKCDYNHLINLLGAPSNIGGRLFCDGNQITSLHNIHKMIKHIKVDASFTNNQIRSSVLGLLLIDGLQDVYLDNKKVEAIINKYLKGDKDVDACKKELIENGFDDFAQL